MGDVNEFIGAAKARLHALEKRAEKWDTSIERLKEFHSKGSVLAVLAMFFVSFLMNYAINFFGLF